MPTWGYILLPASSPRALAKLCCGIGRRGWGSGEGDVVTRTTSCHCCVESQALPKFPLVGVGEPGGEGRSWEGVREEGFLLGLTPEIKSQGSWWGVLALLANW